MLKKLSLALLGVLAIAGALVGTKVLQFRAMIDAGASMVPPPTTVTAAPAAIDEWERSVASTGTLAAVNGVTLRAETPGRVIGVDFESGTPVSQGDVLVRLDTATEQAQLRAAEATAALAKANLERARGLRENRSVSQAELDAADAAFKEASAQAESIRTTIAKKTIRAPFTGRLGMREVDLGEVLREGDAITTLQTLDPIYVDFSLPQQRLSVLDAGSMHHRPPNKSKQAPPPQPQQPD
jgi:membrane fusion protein (multidrug efflux system)